VRKRGGGTLLSSGGFIKRGKEKAKSMRRGGKHNHQRVSTFQGNGGNPGSNSCDEGAKTRPNNHSYEKVGTGKKGMDFRLDSPGGKGRFYTRARRRLGGSALREKARGRVPLWGIRKKRGHAGLVKGSERTYKRIPYLQIRAIREKRLKHQKQKTEGERGRGNSFHGESTGKRSG